MDAKKSTDRPPWTGEKLSKIDWSKPIRLAGGSEYPATVDLVCSHSGNRLVSWRCAVQECRAFVMADGRLLSTLHNGAGASQGRFVENVPEEPKDHLVLIKPFEDEDWELSDRPRGNLFTKEHANEMLRNIGGKACIIVKVPV